MSATRKVGYLLLIFGFVIIVGRLLLQQLDRAAHAGRVTTEVMNALGNPDSYKTTGEVQAHVYHITLSHATRVTASLFPGCLMLAGGLLLGIRQRPSADRTSAKGVSSEASHDQPAVGQVSWDHPIGWRPEQGVTFHKAFLRLARRAIARSSFFRNRRSEDHVDADGS